MGGHGIAEPFLHLWVCALIESTGSIVEPVVPPLVDPGLFALPVLGENVGALGSVVGVVVETLHRELSCMCARVCELGRCFVRHDRDKVLRFARIVGCGWSKRDRG